MKRVLLAVAAAPMMFGAAAHAQTDEAITREIIVTAPGPDRTADELISSTTAVNRAEILQNLSSTLGDTLDSQPGVSTTFFGAGASRPVLRGLGAERVLVLTNGIGVIDASAASPDHQVTADGIDAERIEILRGPAALAYGGQAIGGVVNVIDGLIVERLPERAFGGDLFGAYNSVVGGEELGGRGFLSQGPFVLSLSASSRDFDDYEINSTTESARLLAEEGETAEEADTLENSFVETDTFGAGLSLVGDKGFVGVAVRLQEALYGLPGHGHEEEGGGGGEPEEEEESPFIDLEQTRIDLRGGLAIDRGVFTDLIGTLAISDYEHTEFEAPGEPGTRYESEGYEGRVELDTRFKGFEGALGGQFIDKELNAFGDEAFITPTDSKNWALFTYQTREWDNGIGIEGGLRYERAELDNVGSDIFDGGERTFDLTSASFGVHRHFENGWFVGSQLSYSQRAPNESELFAFGDHLATQQFEIGDVDLDKESGLNLELATRYNATGPGFGLLANIFVTDFKDFIFLEPGEFDFGAGPVDESEEGLPVTFFRQEDAQFFGGEIYGTYRAPEGPLGAAWFLQAGVDIVESELDGGGNVPLQPPLTFNASANANFGVVSLSIDATHAQDQDEPGDGELPTDGYTVVNLGGALALSEFGVGRDGTELFLQARNVGDEEVRFATSVLKDIAPAPGRNIRAGLRIAF